jgi:hypothetical protein
VEELVKNNGAPDVVGTVGNYTVLGWNRVEGYHVMGLYAEVQKYNLVALVDRNGNVVASGEVKTGEGESILGCLLAPIPPVENK